MIPVTKLNPDLVIKSAKGVIVYIYKVGGKVIKTIVVDGKLARVLRNAGKILLK